MRDKNGRFVKLTTSAKIRKLAAQGKTNSEIRKALGISYHHVYSVVQAAKRDQL